jgi:hypothetical protein
MNVEVENRFEMKYLFDEVIRTGFLLNIIKRSLDRLWKKMTAAGNGLLYLCYPRDTQIGWGRPFAIQPSQHLRPSQLRQNIYRTYRQIEIILSQGITISFSILVIRVDVRVHHLHINKVIL